MAKILIVDDSLMDRKLTMNLLKKSGVDSEVLQAANGEEGLKVLSENFKDIALILLDWQMPVMDGLEFMEGVVKVPEVSNIPIIMITASGGEDAREQARTVNPKLAGYVVKPYKPQELIDLISQYLN